MNAKQWLKILFIFMVSIVALLELKYQIFPLHRHEVDYLLKEQLPKLKNKSYKTIILGDSLAHNAFSILKLKKGILDLTSNKAISLAGDYYILKRYLKQNSSPKEVYLFAIPAFLHYELNSYLTYSYYETVFTHEEEIQEMQKLKPELYRDLFTIDRFFEKRDNAFNFSGYKPKERKKYLKIEEKDLKKNAHYMNQKIKDNIVEATNFRDIIEEMPKVYFDKIMAICKQKGIKLTVVIEPVFKAYNPLYYGSKWDNYLKEKATNGDIVYKNINDYYQFNVYFFKKDGRHLNKKVNQYYQGLLDKHVLDLF